MIKIVHVSDLHLVAPGETLFGLDPLAQLEACINDINLHHADASLVIITGDLTERGEPAAYAALASKLESLAVPYRLTLGNHDNRGAFRAAFPQEPTDDGFVQSIVDTPEGRLILLDTLDQGNVGGRLCSVRLDWLNAQLETATSRVLLFMHHPPFPTHTPSLDDALLADHEELRQVILRHGNVHHISAGHVHRAMSGTWAGVPFNAVRGTSHQSALKFQGPYEAGFETPAYSVMLLDNDGIVIHLCEFRR